MTGTRAKLICLAVTCGMLLPAQAGEVYKWVDADGLTHYSDEPPEAVETTLIELPGSKVVRTADAGGQAPGDYYSISNQWQRMNQERLERERLNLERAKIRAARQTPVPPVPASNDDEVRYVTIYRGFGFPYHHRRPHRFRHDAGYRPQAPAAVDLGTFPTQ